MSKIKLSIYAIAITLSSIAYSQENTSLQTEFEIREMCSYDKAGIRACLEEKQKISEQALRQAEMEMQAMLAKWEQDASHINKSTQQLNLANESYKKFKKDQCDLAYLLGGSAIGNALDVRQLACETELNNRRAEQLRAFTLNLP